MTRHAEHVSDGAMRLDVGAEFVTAEKRVAAEERVAFAFEIKILRQPDHFVTVFFHPAGKMRRFTGAFLCRKLLGINLFPTVSPAFAVKTMSGNLGCGGDEMNLASKLGQASRAVLSIVSARRGFRAAGAAHPGIDLVFDAVMVRRTKQ